MYASYSNGNEIGYKIALLSLGPLVDKDGLGSKAMFHYIVLTLSLFGKPLDKITVIVWDDCS